MLFLHPSTATDAGGVANAAPSSTPSSSAEQAAPKVRKLHCNERAHDLRMRAFERISEQRVEKLQSEFLDRQLAPTKAPKTSEQIQEETSEWEEKRAELEADLQDIQKQVTPYLKLHMCEIKDRQRESVQQESDTVQQTWSGQCCMFTVWRPGDEHRELLIPGREFIIYGCTVYNPPGRSGHPLNRQRVAAHELPALPHERYITAGSNQLGLSTSRMTNIVPYALRQAKGAAAPMPSVHVPIRSEYLRSSIYLRPGELLSMPRNAEFDCVCVVVSVDDAQPWTSAASVEDTREFGKSKSAAIAPPPGWSRSRQLLCFGMSGDVMFIEVDETDAVMHFPQQQPLQLPQVMVIENLQYRTFDKNLRIHAVTSTPVSKFLLKGPIEMGSAKAMQAWTHTLYQQPTLGLFQAWLSQSSTLLLCDLILKQGRQMRDGSWNQEGVVISSFNTEDFKSVSDAT